MSTESLWQLESKWRAAASEERTALQLVLEAQADLMKAQKKLEKAEMEHEAAAGRTKREQIYWKQALFASLSLRPEEDNTVGDPDPDVTPLDYAPAPTSAKRKLSETSEVAVTPLDYAPAPTPTEEVNP